MRKLVTATAVRQLDMLQADGLNVVRFDVGWRGLEPQRGVYQYLDKLDRIIDEASARGIWPIMTIAVARMATLSNPRRAPRVLRHGIVLTISPSLFVAACRSGHLPQGGGVHGQLHHDVPATH